MPLSAVICRPPALPLSSLALALPHPERRPLRPANRHVPPLRIVSAESGIGDVPLTRSLPRLGLAGAGI